MIPLDGKWDFNPNLVVPDLKIFVTRKVKKSRMVDAFLSAV